MTLPLTTPFSVNGRLYTPPAAPVVVVCLDGWADEYLDAAFVRNRMPHLQTISVQGYRGLARGALPSFTNVNNASIVTGVAPAQHGISGNFFLDPELGAEVMMNSGHYLRVETILVAAARAGRRVAMVTAKEKLRDLLAHGLKGIAFSAEKASEAVENTHGIARVEELVGKRTPGIYTPEASLFVLQAGAALISQGKADFIYLSLTDYVQHKYSPGQSQALDFCAAVDREIGQLVETGAVIGLTADHGMNSKQTAAGEPNVIYLQSELETQFGPGFKVILPITDPYVIHHGALGSFAMIYLPDKTFSQGVESWLGQRHGITEIYDRPSAALKLELPADRIGDLVVMAGRDVVIGRTESDHDLKALDAGLRSHGGRYEEMVPFLVSKALNPHYAALAAGDPRNFDIFDFTVNGVQA